MKYALIFLIVCIGIVSFFYPKIKKVLLSSAKKGSKEDYIKLKAEIEKAIESDDEALEAYDALYTTMFEYNELLRNNGQEELSGELPLKGQLFDSPLLMNVNTFGSICFPYEVNSKRRRKNASEQSKRTYPIYFEANKLHLNAGFCLLPMTYFPLGEEMSITVLYGFAKDSLLASDRFSVNRGDKLILDTIFDTFTYVVKDIGAIEENDTDYLKANDNQNELVLANEFTKHRRNIVFRRCCVMSSRGSKVVNGQEITPQINQMPDICFLSTLSPPENAALFLGN